MKRLLMICVLALSACATTTQAPLPDQVATAIQEVTLARQAATQLLLSNKITLAQDQAVQSVLDLIRAKLQSAQGLTLSNPAEAANLLAEALTALANYQQGQTK